MGLWVSYWVLSTGTVILWSNDQASLVQQCPWRQKNLVWVERGRQGIFILTSFIVPCKSIRMTTDVLRWHQVHTGLMSEWASEWVKEWESVRSIKMSMDLTGLETSHLSMSHAGRLWVCTQETVLLVFSSCLSTQPTLTCLNEHSQCFGIMANAWVSHHPRRHKLYCNYLRNEAQYFRAAQNYSSAGFHETHALYFQPVLLLQHNGPV